MQKYSRAINHVSIRLQCFVDVLHLRHQGRYDCGAVDWQRRQLYRLQKLYMQSIIDACHCTGRNSVLVWRCARKRSEDPSLKMSGLSVTLHTGSHMNITYARTIVPAVTWTSRLPYHCTGSHMDIASALPMYRQSHGHHLCLYHCTGSHMDITSARTIVPAVTWTSCLPVPLYRQSHGHHVCPYDRT
jgi:hypothetical protein